jgi:hypothetical protein
MEQETSHENREQLTLTIDTENLLIAAARWASFLGILAFVFAGFGVINVVIFIFGGAFLSSITQLQFSPYIFAFAAILSVVLYSLIGYYLTGFGSKCKKALLHRNTNDMELAMGYLKSHFMVMGILAIVFIALMMAAMAVAIVAAFMAAG